MALVLARLGLPAEALVKIRRKPPAVVAATASAVPSPGAMRTGAFAGRTTTSSSESPGCRKRGGDGWGPKVDGSPVSSGVGSPSARRHLSGAADGALASSSTLCRPQHQAASRSNTFPLDFERRAEEPPFSDGVGGRCETVHPVSPLEPLLDGDVLVLSCPRSTMISFQGSVLSECVKGLEILGATAEQLQRVALSTKAASFVELVLSDCNHFAGRFPSGQDGALLASRYDCRVVAVRHTPTTSAVNGRRRTEEGEGSLDELDQNRFALSSPLSLGEGAESVSSPLHVGEKKKSAVFSAAVQGAFPGDPVAGAAAAAEEYSVRGVEAAARPLAPGDVVLVLAREGFSEMWKDALEFDLVTQVGVVPKAVAAYDYLSLLVFCGMLGWVLFSNVAMVSWRPGVRRGGNAIEAERMRKRARHVPLHVEKTALVSSSVTPVLTCFYAALDCVSPPPKNRLGNQSFSLLPTTTASTPPAFVSAPWWLTILAFFC